MSNDAHRARGIGNLIGPKRFLKLQMYNPNIISLNDLHKIQF